MKCPYCKSTDTFLFYSINMPNILSACPEETLAKSKIYPFEASLCRQCDLGFNSAQLTDAQLKEIYDHYLYISPKSGIGHTKYIGMIETLLKTFKPSDKIVEIGCSEGYLLGKLKEAGFENLTGIEPGPQSEDARAAGLNIIKSYFDEGTLSGQIVDGFYLMHVYEHFTDPFTILRTMKNSLSTHGSIVIEVPNFEVFNHQHLFFYSLPFMNKLANDLELKITNAYTDKGILRVVLTHKNNERVKEIQDKGENIDMKALAAEKKIRFESDTNRIIDMLKEFSGKTLYLWGAGSTGVIYLNHLADEIKKNKVTVNVVDGDKNKWNCYVPGIGLRVNSCETLRDQNVDCLIVASEFYREIKQTIQDLQVSVGRLEVFDS